jgi:hypothetical protein
MIFEQRLVPGLLRRGLMLSPSRNNGSLGRANYAALRAGD